MVKKLCVVCETSFHTKGATKTCSKPCNKTNETTKRKESNKQYRIKNLEKCKKLSRKSALRWYKNNREKFNEYVKQRYHNRKNSQQKAFD